MARAHTFSLALLAFGLVTGGTQEAMPVIERSGELPLATVIPVDRAERIASIVQGHNSVLSDAESARIGRAVIQSADRHGLDPDLVTAVLLVESGGRPWARSHAGAVGLMQVMPHMAATMDLAGNLTTIESNVEAGCMILADNIRRLGEDDGISAYFWGSNIRGVAYLDRVRAARAAVRLSSES